MHNFIKLVLKLSLNYSIIINKIGGNDVDKSNNKIGMGILSFVLFIIGTVFPITFRNNLAIGDTLLQSLGLKAWSNGNAGYHYTVVYSLIFFAISIILGYKYRNNLLAKIAGILSIITILIFVILLFIPTT